ncbi:hypothetical protein TNCV_1669951 [Trichonephila clavipes]|nr:hypothetical protein TNCV_1669951 [Trichonephila clavipes]
MVIRLYAHAISWPPSTLSSIVAVEERPVVMSVIDVCVTFTKTIMPHRFRKLISASQVSQKAISRKKCRV